MDNGQAGLEDMGDVWVVGNAGCTVGGVVDEGCTEVGGE